MKKSTKYLGVTALMLAILFSSASSLYAAEDKGGPFKDLTQDQRDELKELRDSGDFEALQTKMKEYGIELKAPKMMGNFDKEKTDAVKSALEANDYDAFVDAVGETIAEKVTEDNFSIMVEAHKLREVGDYEAAREKMQEIKEVFPMFGKMPHFPIDIESLSDEDKAVLEEVKNLHDEGKHEEAHELMKETFGDRIQEFKETMKEKREGGFFKKIGNRIGEILS